MARYRGEVEQARRALREQGCSTDTARAMAPGLSAHWETQRDQRNKPFSWLGAPSTSTHSGEVS